MRESQSLSRLNPDLPEWLLGRLCTALGISVVPCVAVRLFSRWER